MARINIDDGLFKRNAWFKLIVATGSADGALGTLVRTWIVAQRFWFPERKPIPRGTWDTEELNQAVIDSGLAEEREDGIYVHGSEAQFAWLFQKSEAGKKGGRPKSAVKRKKADDEREEAEESGSKPLTLSPSLTLKKEERESLSEENLGECIQAWGETLKRLGVKKKPELDQEQIARLIQRHGSERTKLALVGAGFEEASEDYDPKKHVSILRLQKQNVFETFVNLGAQLDSNERQTTKWNLGQC